MTDAEMRGLDMQDDQDCTDCEGSGITHQTERYCTCAAGRELARYANDAPEQIWATEDKANFGEDRFHATQPMRGLTEYTRTDLCITEAECQRRIDAAVLAEREAAKSLVWTLGHEIKAAMLVDEDNERTVLDMVKATAAAIRARGQK